MVVTITDMFCGSGGSSTGAVAAGAEIKYALNHWARAIETHNTNHPQAIHACVDLHMEDARRYKPTTGLIASPECTNHSLAKGAKKRVKKAKKKIKQTVLWEGDQAEAVEEEDDEELLKQERSRCLMYTPLNWAERHGYKFAIMENVVDAAKWGPGNNGALFRGWLGMWDALGYETRCISLNSMFAGAPQSRDRIYIVAWQKGIRAPDLDIRPDAHCHHCNQSVQAKQTWKRGRTVGKYRQQYIYTCPLCRWEVVPFHNPAATILDWSLPIQRIGDRKRPLQEKTMGRIQEGIATYMASPMLLQMSRGGRIRPAQTHPLPTQTKYDDTALVTPPFMMDHLGEYRPRPLDRAMSTICAGGNHHSVITPPHWARVLSYYNNGSITDPMVRSLSTVTTVERHGLLTSDSTDIRIEDCGFRMLATKEIQAAMAFPEDYILTGTRAEQVHQLGDGVTPPVMQLLISRMMEVL